MSDKKFPEEIPPELWQEGLEIVRRREAEAAKLREPWDRPIVSTADAQILEELLEEKDTPNQGQAQ